MYVESPQFIRKRNTLWLIGSPSWAWMEPRSVATWPADLGRTPNRAGVRIPIMDRGQRLGPGTVIPMPAGVYGMSTLRAALSDGDDLHLLWGAASGDTGSAALHRVWTAGWRRGEWSVPSVFIDAKRDVTWANSKTSGVTNVAGTSYVFAPLTFKDTVLVLRASGEGWKLATAPFEDHIYSGIASIPGDSRRLFVSFVKLNKIYAAEFDIATNETTRSSHLASFPAGAAIQTRLLVPTRDRRTVVWLESSAGKSRLWHLRIAESSDRGRKWHAGETIQVGSNAGILQATSDNAGRVHVIFDPAYTTPSAPVHAVWDGKTWRREMLPVREGFVVPSPSVTSWERDSILAVWAMAESMSSRPVTFWSIGRPCRS